MASLLRNLFSKSNADVDPQPSPEKTMLPASQPAYSPTAQSGYVITSGESYYTSTSGERQEDQLPNIVHVRANTEQRWVSAEDAMNAIDSTLEDGQIQLAIKRLMRQAYIKAQWPPNKTTPEEVAKQTFVAVAFDNLYLLFDDDCYDWETAEAKQVKKNTRLHQIEEFLTDLEYLKCNPGHQMDGKLVILVDDAKKTSSQIRYERDVRERITKGNDYYRMKKARDATFRTRNAKRKSTPPPNCDECGKPSNSHWMWCRKMTV